jgi:hypothetical protein
VKATIRKRRGGKGNEGEGRGGKEKEGNEGKRGEGRGGKGSGKDHSPLTTHSDEKTSAGDPAAA